MVFASFIESVLDIFFWGQASCGDRNSSNRNRTLVLGSCLHCNVFLNGCVPFFSWLPTFFFSAYCCFKM